MKGKANIFLIYLHRSIKGGVFDKCQGLAIKLRPFRLTGLRLARMSRFECKYWTFTMGTTTTSRGWGLSLKILFSCFFFVGVLWGLVVDGLFPKYSEMSFFFFFKSSYID